MLRKGALLLLRLPLLVAGIQTPALAAVVPAGGAAGPAGAKTYRCIKGYLVNGTAMGNVQVWPSLRAHLSCLHSRQ
jgi:hypothetical protein